MQGGLDELLTWTTEQRKLSDLADWPSNPRRARNGKTVIFRDAWFTCESCDVKFQSKGACKKRIPRFCSRQCYGKSLIRWSFCEQCGERYCTAKHGARNKRFCSKVCYSEWMQGKSLSIDHIASLSRAKKGKPIPHLHNEEVRQKISKALTGKAQPWIRGENHPNYVDGGRSQYERNKAMGRVEYKSWRRAVFERDDYICQECKTRGGRLTAHHIKAWARHPDLRYQANNGLTLCRDCHIRIHSNEILL